MNPLVDSRSWIATYSWITSLCACTVPTMTYAHIHTHTHTHTRTHAHACTYMHICIIISTHTHVYTHIFIIGEPDTNRPVPFRLTPALQLLISQISVVGPLQLSMVAVARCLVQPHFGLENILRAVLRDNELATFLCYMKNSLVIAALPLIWRTFLAWTQR